MEISYKKDKNYTIVTVNGRMDAVCAPDFENTLEERLTEGELLFILDFSGLEYISSAGLQCVLAAAKKLESQNGRIVLTSLNGTVREVFEISGFDTLFPIFNSLEEALNS